MTGVSEVVPSSKRSWRSLLLTIADRETRRADETTMRKTENVYHSVPRERIVETVEENGGTETAVELQLEIALDAQWIEEVETGFIPSESNVTWVTDDEDDDDEVKTPGFVEVDDQEEWERLVDPDSEHPVSDERIRDAMNAAAEYFETELTEMVIRGAQKRWGLTEETVREAGIGYCPDDDDLVEYLSDRGFSEVEMLATGLLSDQLVRHAYNDCGSCSHDVPEDIEMLAAAVSDGEVSREDVDLMSVVRRVQEFRDGALNLYNWWDNRIVIPYYDGGDVTCFGARRTGSTEDRVYSDGSVAKYVKLPTTKQWTHDFVDEPVFRGDRVADQGDELIVTEGFTDALAAAQRGYDAVAPATTQFSSDSVEDVAEIADGFNDVIVVMDNDDPESVDGISPGLMGSLKTAVALRESGVDAVVGVLPRVEGDETDMADYLTACADDDPLREVINDARDPREFDEFDELDLNITNSVSDDGDGDGDGDGGDSVAVAGDEDASGSSSGGSELFDLEISDVAGPNVPNSPGDRGKNPFLGALNSTGNHFQVIDDDSAFDHHAEVKSTYTALTWLLCDAGVRDPRDPEGELSVREIFEAWRYAKKKGVIPRDDRIPWRARLHIIKEHELMPPVCIPESWEERDQIPDSVWGKLERVVRDEYGVDPGL